HHALQGHGAHAGAPRRAARAPPGLSRRAPALQGEGRARSLREPLRLRPDRHERVAGGRALALPRRAAPPDGRALMFLSPIALSETLARNEQGSSRRAVILEGPSTAGARDTRGPRSGRTVE